MILGAWRRSWLAYVFDRGSGVYHRRLVRHGEPLPISGFGSVEKTREFGRMFFGLYRWGGCIWFQAGTRSWRLDTADLRLLYRAIPGQAASEFRLFEGDTLAFHCSYRHRLRSLLARADASSDNIDFETNHFLAHVAGQRLPRGDSEEWHDGEAAISRQTASDVRHAVRDHLGLLADLERQLDYERRVQIADVPAELFCGWFDDSYHPDSPLFRQAFAPGEREVLKRFTAVLDAASYEIGEVTGVDDLQSRPIWARVVLEAESALRHLPEGPVVAHPASSTST
jgi:hypothetical protein